MGSLTIDRSEVLRRLGDIRLSAADIVPRPDHPYLMQGPDALLASEGRLWSIFIPHSRERTVPQDLLVRQGLVRLALGPTSRSALMLQPGAKNPLSRNDEHNFEELIYADRIRQSLVRLASGPRFRHMHVDAWRAPMERMHRILSDSHYLARKRQETDAIGTLVSQDIKNIDDHIVRLESKTATRQELRKSLLDAMRRSFMDEFSLDNGVPYSNYERLPVHRFFVPSPDAVSYARDPNKSLRSAALAGWAIGG